MGFSYSMKLWLSVIALWSIEVVIAGNEEAKIVFYYGRKPYSSETYELNDADEILDHPKFDLNRGTVFYVHGYIEEQSSPTVQMIIDAYTKLNTYNLLILDWSALAGGLYPLAVGRSIELGPRLAEVFIDLFDRGLSYLKLHLVGHSLGAHLSGHIGREIIKQSKGEIKLQRITGLDPAAPFYYPPLGINHVISERDAELVDIIHTDKGRYGAPVATGKVDFWPNGGSRTQPGCPFGLFIPLSDQDLCSHQRSVALYAESVGNPLSTFLSTNMKDKSQMVQMGLGIPADVKKGSYELKTNAAYPYSKSQLYVN